MYSKLIHTEKVEHSKRGNGIAEKLTKQKKGLLG